MTSKTWQIISHKSGRTLALIYAHTPSFALDEYARSNGHKDFIAWSEYLGLKPEYHPDPETGKILID